jgi:DNA-binding response OmpR family regulator
MPDLPKAVAFDLDAASLASLRQAFPGWKIEPVEGADPGSLERDWDPGAAALLVVGPHDRPADTLGLCRGLRSQAGRAHTPLLVLAPPAQEALLRAALEVGPDSCLVLPVHVRDLIRRVARLQAAQAAGRHALGQAREGDPWRDDGGEA